VSITMKAAPGAGIVSTLVLQSDDLDEIDMEWLGADGTEVQTNYFGKGDVTTYNRGAFNPAANNQGEFITYTVEWTATQVTWSVGGTIVRVLTPATADTNQYPQTPMQVKFGAWSGGDSSNAAGTISWARGPTNYADGPFTMVVQSIAVTDYSTGTQYKYGDTTGTWGSIVAVGGKINGNSGGAASSIASADVPAVTSASPSIPAGVGSTHGSTSTLTGWPWVATTLSTVTGTSTSVTGVPSGWIITSSGKIVPASSAAVRKLGPPSICCLNKILLTYARPYQCQLPLTRWPHRSRNLYHLLAVALKPSPGGTTEASRRPEQSHLVTTPHRKATINKVS